MSQGRSARQSEQGKDKHSTPLLKDAPPQYQL